MNSSRRLTLAIACHSLANHCVIAHSQIHAVQHFKVSQTDVWEASIQGICVCRTAVQFSRQLAV